jgi:ABC-type transporter Mla subunit MlaD
VQNINKATYAIGTETATNEKNLRRQTKDIHQTIEGVNQLISQGTKVVSALGETVVSANALIGHTDTSINQKITPNIEMVLRGATEAEGTLNQQLVSLQKPIQNMSEAASAFARDTPPVMKNLQDTSLHFSQTTELIVGITGDIKKYADKLVAPEKWTIKILHGIWNALKTAFYMKGLIS